MIVAIEANPSLQDRTPYMSAQMRANSVDETSKKACPFFQKGHAFSGLHQDVDYFVFGAAGFFTAITAIEEAIILPPSFL